MNFNTSISRRSVSSGILPEAFNLACRLQGLRDAFNFFSGKEEDAMRGRKIILPVMAVFLMLAALPASVMAAAVSAECAWTATDMACEVYVDTAGVALRSGGVLLNYSTSKLTGPVASKNGDLWKFSAGGGTNYPYMNPDTSVAGQVVFIVGMLDTTNTDLGVSGARVKIGDVRFTRAGDLTNPAPGTSGANQATFFGISAALGKTGDYVNFVNTSGVPLDSPTNPTFTAQVYERGDADGNGIITSRDLAALRGILSNGSPYVVYADCDGNGIITSRDIACVRGLLN
jgi:phage baseplate assembly protein gpV